MHTEGPQYTKKSFNMSQFLRLSLFIFVILFVGSVSLGLSPIGVQEINNAFFSLFIHNNSIKAEETIPQITLTESTSSLQDQSFVEPATLSIPTISLNVTVNNPQSTDVSVLDNALLSGAVRYPGSGSLESYRNILIFGHSSGLKVIHNQNFKIFNDLKLLTLGDDIYLYSKEKEYHYKVTWLRLAKSSEIEVSFGNEHKLILSTCNTFGAKEERYVVEASFIESRAL